MTRVDTIFPELRPGQRISLRRRLPGGQQSDLIGFLTEVNPGTLVLEDRQGSLISIEREQILAIRRVAPALGRDPGAAPAELLAGLVDRAGLRGGFERLRISELLRGRTPPAVTFLERGSWTDGVHRARVEGEWLVTDAPEGELLIALAWWATRQNARSVLRVTSGPLQGSD